MSAEQIHSSQSNFRNLKPDCAILMRPEISSTLRINNEVLEELGEKFRHLNKRLVAILVAGTSFVINPLAGIIMSSEVIRPGILVGKRFQQTSKK